ncbi:MAG TPA: energy transducer TonB [Oculatellaceae cyanobacterium]|jgi:outer membrane biosynthesis protein TonB
MSYFPSSQNLPELLLNPSAIAVVVSIGIHGLLALSLPTLSADSKEEEQNIRRSVEVVALTPTEQARLPQTTSLPPLTTNTQPLPLTPPLTSLPVVPLLPPSGNYSSNIPLIRLPPISRNDTLPPVSPLRPRPLIIQIPQERRLQPRRQFKIDDRPFFANREFPQPDVRETEAPRSENSEPKTEVQPDNSSQPQVIDTTPEPQSTPEPTPVAQQPQPEPQASIDPSQQQITRDETGTSDEAGRNNLIAWATKTRNPQDQDLGQSFVDLLEKLRKGEAPIISLSPAYPKAACPNKLAGAAVMGVLVDAKGQLAEEPFLIKSSGYAIFNQIAQEALKVYQFQNNIGKTQPYIVDVKFEYDSKLCSEPTPSPTPTQ